ncbi:MAG: hypothetical protein ACK5L7_06445 [Paludibacteraceae bacterium]
MDKTLKIFLVSLVGVIAFVILIESLRTQPMHWQQTYSLDYKNPFDLYVFEHEIPQLFQRKPPEIVKTDNYPYFKNKNRPVANYIIIKHGIYSETDTLLLNEIKKGSSLFISAATIRQDFLDSIGVDTYYTGYGPELLKIDTLKLSLLMRPLSADTLKISSYFNEFVFLKMDKKSTSILGVATYPNGIEYPTFIKVAYGKGYIFLHNQPIVFTNYSLLNKNSSATYVAGLMSYLPKELPLVWLAKGQTTRTSKELENTTTPLSVIFRYPSLRMTWLIFLYGLLLFVLFSAKRRQRTIPIISPLQNTTVEFVQTISNLYFQDGNATNITEKKIIYFLDKVRNKYYLNTDIPDENFVRRLHSKSNKDIQLIKNIVYQINKFYKEKYANQDFLIHINKLMEDFWEE